MTIYNDKAAKILKLADKIEVNKGVRFIFSDLSLESECNAVLRKTEFHLYD